MNSYKKNAFVYAGIVAMGGFVFGLDAALISGTLNYLVQEFSLTELELGSIVGAPALGVIFALPFAAYASNELGRRKTLQIIAALYVISAISSALAPTFSTLIAARFLGGLAFSSITLASMYIGEISPPKWRGKLVSMNQINIVVGLSAAYFLNYLILQLTNSDLAWVENIGLKDHTWRWMLGSEVIFALIWFGLLFFIPQSPSWLVFKGRIEDAKKSLQKIFPSHEVPVQIEEIQSSLNNRTDDLSILSQLGAIFKKKMRVVFIIAITIAIAQQSTGINAILFYAPMVFEQIGMGTDAAFIQAIWIGLISVVFTILSLLIIDKVGRRPLILWGMIWIILSLGLCSYAFNNARYILDDQEITEMTELPNPERLKSIVGTEFQSDIEFKQAIIQNIGEEEARVHSSLLLQKATKMNAMLVLFAILSFIAAFQFSVGPIMWVLFSELFPITLRSIAIPFFALITSVTSLIVQQFFPWQLANMGATSVFLFYAVTVAIGFVILYYYLPETKNLTIEEIQEKLESRKA